ncbi:MULTISPECIES: universal stress protein [unclassified Halorhabdus]|uniref:universal stress protein n=1 Tax=unclassified Halorhabdus TaxID=2621901 RepID=UPI0023DC17D3|nr:MULTISPECIES: universal stress protein [unclassified Halorhabdus]WEL16835.1 Nucleotide-binding protein, UspA family [Halorhabdus sp. SVX81]WEL20709.1 Nucleotide-binding protein, UspA family [Halorhabdus sp. BNX81]
MAVEIDTVLVPVDGTDRSEQAIEHALPIAARYGAELHVLHVIDEAVAAGLEHGNIEADSVANEHRAFMRAVREQVHADGHDIALSQSTAFGYSASSLRRHPVSVILDAAEDIEADFIVIPRQCAIDEPGAMLGKVAEYVLSYASQPVLSV